MAPEQAAGQVRGHRSGRGTSYAPRRDPLRPGDGAVRPSRRRPRWRPWSRCGLREASAGRASSSRACRATWTPFGLKCLQKEPRKRYPSAEELAGRSWAVFSVASQSRPGPVSRLGKGRALVPAVIRLAASLLALLGLALGRSSLGMGDWRPPERDATEDQRRAAVTAGERAEDTTAANPDPRLREVERQKGIVEPTGNATPERQPTWSVRRRRALQTALYHASVLLGRPVLVQQQTRSWPSRSWTSARRSLRGWEWRYPHPAVAVANVRTLRGHTSPVSSLAFSARRPAPRLDEAETTSSESGTQAPVRRFIASPRKKTDPNGAGSSRRSPSARTARLLALPIPFHGPAVSCRR